MLDNDGKCSVMCLVHLFLRLKILPRLALALLFAFSILTLGHQVELRREHQNLELGGARL